jgi:hypothetical protein
MIDENLVDALSEIAQRLMFPLVTSALGSEHQAELSSLFLAVREVHRAIDTERMRAGLSVAIAIDSATPFVDSPPVVIDQISSLTSLHVTGNALAIEVMADGTFRVWAEQPVNDVSGHLAYRFLGFQNEIIEVNGETIRIPSLPNMSSCFAVPYFRDLRHALMHYRLTCARKSDCEFLTSSWRDGARLVFVPGPEYLMRRSLRRFLRQTLRNHSSVMAEQIVDETHPVDLKVTWTSSNRVVLIEIKWLGKSADVGADHFTAEYGAPRARAGARQLCDYLDTYCVESPGEEATGVLAVFDGRRANLHPATIELSDEDGNAFALSEIDFQGTDSRPDFEHVRLFLEPA